MTDFSGCLDKDKRLGPAQLPTTGGAGSVYAYIGKITLGYEPFGASKTEDAFLKEYWGATATGCPTPKANAWCYPPNGGFATKDKKVDHYSLMLKVGTLVDRFGSATGTYMAPALTSYAARALPPMSLDTFYCTPACPTYHYNYHLYKVLKPFKVDAGPVAPAFGQNGGGLQYVTCFSRDFTTPCGSPNVAELLSNARGARGPDLQEQKLPLK